jgi:hypothetical protein
MAANPFHGVVIGSTVDMSGIFHGSALSSQARITQLVPAPDVAKSMRGQSDLVYTTQMNQASIAIAGAYGISGVEKVTAAVSAYAGAASAESEKSVGVTCEVIISADAETVVFNELSPIELLTALSRAPRAMLTDVLDCYNKLMGDLGGEALLAVMSDAKHPAHPVGKASYEKWARAVRTSGRTITKEW